MLLTCGVKGWPRGSAADGFQCGNQACLKVPVKLHRVTIYGADWQLRNWNKLSD
jgi:hypothetical protein